MSVINVKKHATVEVETPQLNRTSIYIKTDNSLAWKDDTGTEHVAATGISPEEVQDIIGSTFIDSATVDFVYNDAGNTMQASVVQSAIDHGSISGLGDDDHTQYLNNTRGDARYYTKTQLDGGQLDNRYYTESEVNASLALKINNSEKGIANGVATLDASVKIPVVQIPALPYAPTVHTHTASQITDFTTAVQAVGDVRYSELGHTHPNATTTVAGFMSGADKAKLDGLVNAVFPKTVTVLNNSSQTTFTNITELQINCVAGKVYKFKYFLRHTSNATTTGITFSINGTASGSIGAKALMATSRTATSIPSLNSFSGLLAITGVPSTSPEVSTIEGIFVCTGNGTMYPQFRSEANGNNVQILDNSLLEYNEI